jgi:cytoskeletal protein CcmA (bactofilin family)
MWKPNESKILQPLNPSLAENQLNTAVRMATFPVLPDTSRIGQSVVIKGELTSSEPIYIDGSVEGSISAPSCRVTIGREGKVNVNIDAREVVVLGNLCGNVSVDDRVDIRSNGSLTGDVIAQRISIEDGAFFKGAIDIQTPGETDNAGAQEEHGLILVSAESSSGPEPHLDGWAESSLSAADRN